MKTFFIVAGETSGDMHGARLMSALKQQAADERMECRFEGIGGPAMEAEGLNSLVPLRDINVVGFWEVAKKYRFFTRLLEQCRQRLIATRFDAFIPIDYPGFNMRLAVNAKQSRVPVCWYIAPQLWAWGAERAVRLQECVDVLLVVFPFEIEFFRKHGINAQFVGHPLLDAPEFSALPTLIPERKPLVALLPGSRKQEVEQNLPLFLDVAHALASELPSTAFCVAAASHLPRTVYASVERASLDISLTHDSRALMREAATGLVKTGTSTLEAALLGMPFAMAYKTSSLTYSIAKRKITLPYIALANIVAGRTVVQEFIQQAAAPKAITRELLRLLDTGRYGSLYTAPMLEAFAEIRATLGGAGASTHAARHIWDFVR
jgi:lipid-A-disaccharide synthase